MDALFRAAVHAGGGLDGTDPDAALIAAVRQTATTPAAAIGWTHVGDLAPGLRADFVVLDETLHVTRVHAAEASGARL
jgi:N-acetylglucosamine-6-phosphate deacetylase